MLPRFQHVTTKQSFLQACEIKKPKNPNEQRNQNDDALQPPVFMQHSAAASPTSQSSGANRNTSEGANLIKSKGGDAAPPTPHHADRAQQTLSSDQQYTV